MHALRLVLLLHYRVPRLVAVILALQRLLLLRVGIAIPRVLPLV